MKELPDSLSSGEHARLIPVAADTSKEARAASILLATLSAVAPFARTLLADLGHRVGTRAKVDCYTEIVFKKTLDTVKLRPDGLIVLETGGGRSWSALIEAKIGRAQLEDSQIASYCQLAKANDVNAVVTVSNQFAALPTHHPIRLSKTQSKGIDLYHWSWMHVLTQAMLLLNDVEFENDSDQFILEEMVRYFTHSSIGISTFDQMNPEWRDLVLKVQAGTRLTKSSSEVENSVAAWHQECRDLSLLLSRKLNRHVKLGLPRAHSSDPALRLKDDCEKLVNSHELSCLLNVPDAASPISVAANLARRSLVCSMALDAPKDKKRSSARINWIIKQLERTKAEGIFIKAKWPGRSPDTQATLANLRTNPESLESENKSLVPQSFEVLMIKDLAGKFSGSRTFIEYLESTVPEFYGTIGQNLRTWVAPPPKIKPKEDVEAEEAEGSKSVSETPADDAAAAEQREQEPAEDTGSDERGGEVAHDFPQAEAAPAMPDAKATGPTVKKWWPI